MTTQVKVDVPEGANWDALVEIHDNYDGIKTVKTEVIEPGKNYIGHVTNTRHIVVRERARKA